MARRKPTADEVGALEAVAIAGAVVFTTARFRGRGQWDRREFGSFAEAQADAKGDRKALLYAVSREGYSTLITRKPAKGEQP